MDKRIGNKFNEVWTEETATLFCEDVLSYVKNNEKCRSLTKALVELDGYEELLSYFKTKFQKEFKSISQAKQMIKARLIEQGLDGDANASMAKFVLSNNHGMSEKTESKNQTELSGEVKTKTTINFTKGSK